MKCVVADHNYVCDECHKEIEAGIAFLKDKGTGGVLRLCGDCVSVQIALDLEQVDKVEETLEWCRKNKT